MTTIYLSNGETAEVENVLGHDPRTFTVPAGSYSTFADAMTKGATLKFGQDGPVYLLKKMQGNICTAILQIRRR